MLKMIYLCPAAILFVLLPCINGQIGNPAPTTTTTTTVAPLTLPLLPGQLFIPGQPRPFTSVGMAPSTLLPTPAAIQWPPGAFTTTAPRTTTRQWFLPPIYEEYEDDYNDYEVYGDRDTSQCCCCNNRKRPKWVDEKDARDFCTWFPCTFEFDNFCFYDSYGPPADVEHTKGWVYEGPDIHLSGAFIPANIAARIAAGGAGGGQVQGQRRPPQRQQPQWEQMRGEPGKQSTIWNPVVPTAPPIDEFGVPDDFGDWIDFLRAKHRRANDQRLAAARRRATAKRQRRIRQRQQRHDLPATADATAADYGEPAEYLYGNYDQYGYDNQQYGNYDYPTEAPANRHDVFDIRTIIEEDDYTERSFVIPEKQRFGNRVTGIRKGPFGMVTRYAAAYLVPKEYAQLTIDVTYTQEFNISYMGFENAVSMSLVVCCVNECTEPAEHRGLHKVLAWHRRKHYCPAGTYRVTFLCIAKRTGNVQGACGLDNIRVDQPRCDF